MDLSLGAKRMFARINKELGLPEEDVVEFLGEDIVAQISEGFAEVQVTCDTLRAEAALLLLPNKNTENDDWDVRISLLHFARRVSNEQRQRG